MNKIIEAADFIRKEIDTENIETALVLGSGLSGFTKGMVNRQSIDTSRIPNYPRSTVLGHKGSLLTGELNKKKIMVVSGRVHLYEGYSYDQVVFYVKVLKELGINSLILTNAAGCIREDIIQGEIVLVSKALDPLNNLKQSKEKEFITSYNLNSRIIKASELLNLTLIKGTYGFMTGPTFETPSEIKLLKKLGVDMVGMSTVPEIIQAKNSGMNVAVLSLATNYAAGISGHKLNHKEVFETADKAGKSFIELLSNVL